MPPPPRIERSEPSAASTDIRDVLVESGDAGQRLDVFLAQRSSVEGWTRSAIQKLIVDGSITLNGRSVKPGARLKPGDRVKILGVLAPVETAIVPEPLPLDVLYDDADCIVLNKAAGMVVHPAAGWKAGTLVNALLHRFPDLPGIGGERRPGIVHRLDKDTSGVMVVAKNDIAFQRLAAAFKARMVGKEYVALVWGVMSKREGVIDRAIGRHRSDRKKMSSVRALPRVREARTEWRVENVFPSGGARGRFAAVSLLRLKLHSGRTHQIRVHLADEGHPIVGDAVYGPRPGAFAGEPIAPQLSGFPRQALHAERLRFTHPTSGKPMEFSAPLPADIDRLLEDLAARRALDGEAGEKGLTRRGAFPIIKGT